MFGSDHTLWWSPDGQHILYLTIDDEGVSNIEYPVYTEQEESGDDKIDNYPTIISIPYPKVAAVLCVCYKALSCIM